MRRGKLCGVGDQQIVVVTLLISIRTFSNVYTKARRICIHPAGVLLHQTIGRTCVTCARCTGEYSREMSSIHARLFLHNITRRVNVTHTNALKTICMCRRWTDNANNDVHVVSLLSKPFTLTQLVHMMNTIAMKQLTFAQVIGHINESNAIMCVHAFPNTR